jgi:SAM-dependent methyltransferase
MKCGQRIRTIIRSSRFFLPLRWIWHFFRFFAPYYLLNLSIPPRPQFSWEIKPEPLLARAEKRQGRKASSLSEEEKAASFYSYFTETLPEGYETILENQYRAYLPYLNTGLHEPFLDVGCGTGEFISFLEKNGITAQGIDSNKREVERALAGGLNVINADAVDFLEHTQDRYSGISLIQVIEHIHPDCHLPLIRSAIRRLAEGGVLLIETINVSHPLILNGFYTDPTHVRPVPDDYLVFLLQWIGLDDISLVFTYPVWVPGTNRKDLRRIYYNYAVIGRKGKGAY